MSAGRPWPELPRVPLIETPTPLRPAPRFSEWAGAEVWVKRDDYAPLTLAGNKLRKLEYVLPPVLDTGADTVVTMGAAQSNAARSAAVVAAATGLDCALALMGDDPGPEGRTGNILIEQATGAEVHFTGASDWEGLARAADGLVEDLRRRGRRPELLPLGYSTPLGVAAFAAAFAELEEQLGDRGLRPAALVHASTSGGTHAGLSLGRSLLASETRVIGVDAARVFGAETEAVLDSMIDGGAEALGVARPADAVVDLRFEFLGAGYGEPTEEGVAALRALARLEGILTDPVYSAKALAGLVALARSGELSGPLVFWHTGGVPALFAPRYRAVAGPGE